MVTLRPLSCAEHCQVTARLQRGTAAEVLLSAGFADMAEILLLLCLYMISKERLEDWKQNNRYHLNNMICDR